MKYIKVTGHKELDILMNFVWALMGVGVIAYGAGYLFGVLYACAEKFL